MLQKKQPLLFVFFRNRLVLPLAALAVFLSASPAYSLTFVSSSPAANEIKAAANVKIVVTFGETLDPSAKGNIFIHGAVSGSHTAASAVSGTKITFTPSPAFTPGEKVTVTLKDGNGISMSSPKIWQFSVATPGTGINFIDSGKSIGVSDSRDAAIGDFDRDGDFDVFVASAGNNTLLRNDGKGNFTAESGTIGAGSNGVAVGDLDGDSDADAFVASAGNNSVLKNESGSFQDSGQTLGISDSRGVALGDVDGDGDLDAFVANYGGNKLWINQGNGAFSDSGQALGTSNSNNVALGDVDNDGDLDAVAADSDTVKIWINQNGVFQKNEKELETDGNNVALGDLDGDKDLDVFVVSDSGNSIWINQGNGTFADSSQSVGASGKDVALGDIEGDGDLDAFVVNYNQAHTVWLNDGKGIFKEGQNISSSYGVAVALGNLDGIDGLDAFIANSGQAAKMWQKNRAPVIAEGKSKSVYMDQNGAPTPFGLTLNAGDPDNAENPGRQTLTWRISSPAANGTAEVSGTGTPKAVTYNPVQNYTGSDKFKIEVSDGFDTAVIEITVGIGVGLPEIMEESQGNPVTDVKVKINEDASPADFKLTLYAINPSDTDDLLTWSIGDPARSGTAGISDANTGTVQKISYTPKANANGQDSFKVVVTNTKGGTASVTVIVDVASINDPPQITSQKSLAMLKGTSLSFTKYDLTITDPDHYQGDFTLTVSDGSDYQPYKSGYTAVPPSDFLGFFKVPVKINDGITDSKEFELVINVCPPGDVNGSTISDFADVTLMLQVLSGKNLSGVFIKGNIGDSNGDRKIGPEDASFVLRNLKNSK